MAKDRLPHDVAAALVEHGHLERARRRADAGDWHCARLLADLPGADPEALRPFAEAGVWEAVERLSAALDAQGRTDEALALVRRHASAGGPLAAPRLAALLARLGRTGEVIALLGPHTGTALHAHALVEATA